MYQLNFSLDNLSLMALTIATGFVVDDAIVVIENISRYLEEGDLPRDAALKGSQQIGFTIISLTVSLIAVLIPLLFMGDVVGRLFHEFAITLAATIVISAVVSLTLVPMLCAKLLRPTPAGQGGHGHAATGGRFFQGLLRLYASLLNVVLNHQVATLIVALATFFVTGYLYVAIPKGFFPIQDTGIIQGVTQAAQDDSLRQDGRAPAGLGQGDLGGFGRRKPVLVHRRRRLQRHAQLRPFPHQSQAAREAPIDRQRDHSPLAAGDRRRRRHFAVHAAGAGSVDRHRRQRHPISVHAGKSGSPDVADLDADGSGAPRQAFRNRRRRERFAAQRPFGDRPHRPGERGAIRRHAGDDRQRALRRLRTTHHFDRVHAVEPISRHSRHRSRDDPFAEVVGFDLPALGGLDQRAGAAVCDQRARSEAVAVADFPSQAISGDDDLVQSARPARRWAARSTPSTPRSTTSICPQASRSASRAPRKPSSPRCRTRCSCCWRRSRRCISCSAFSTKASFTRSRFSRRCLRPASAPCSPSTSPAPASTSSASSASCC